MPQVRKLTASDLSIIEDHMLRMTEEDRRLRFGWPRKDEQVREHVRAISFLDTMLFGVVRDGVLVGMAELRWLQPGKGKMWPDTAELAVSVDRDRRADGIGTALLKRCVTAARNCGIEHIYIMCLLENRAMRALAKKFLTTAQIEDGEFFADVKLPPPDGLSLLEQAVQEGGGFLDAVFDVMRAPRADPQPPKDAKPAPVAA